MHHRWVTAEVPSNIALIKYWGKRDAQLQWPANDSLSLTLTESKTITKVRCSDEAFDRFTFSGLGMSDSKTHPEHKIFRHLDFLRKECGFIQSLDIDTKNTFPAGCGIASSASGMGALTAAAIAAWTQVSTFTDMNLLGFSRERIAALARRGSGSACRSFFPGFVLWQAGVAPLEQKVASILDESHWPLADIIVVISSDEKEVGSTQAHELAWTSPLFGPRLAGLAERMEIMIRALEQKDFSTFGHTLEQEAMEMHAVILSSTPPVHYLTPLTCKFIGWLRQMRQRSECPAYFTIDAGPNVHVLCESENVDLVVDQIRRDWPEYTLLIDRIGKGPSMFTEGRHEQ